MPSYTEDFLALGVLLTACFFSFMLGMVHARMTERR